jgi:hypothetical protein
MTTLRCRRQRGQIVLVAISTLWLGFLLERVVAPRLKYVFCDKQAVLTACRQLIANPSEYADDPSSVPAKDPYLLHLSRSKAPYGKKIPSVLRQLNPLGIMIVVTDHKTCVLNDPAPFPGGNNGLIAFAESCKRQYGTIRLTDGLWLIATVGRTTF